MDESEYATLRDMIEEARCDIDDRDGKLGAVFHSIETSLRCVGATGELHVRKENFDPNGIPFIKSILFFPSILIPLFYF